MSKYFNDLWTIDDAFGFAKAGDVLAKIALEAKPPFSVKVTGKWGTGKTSILKRAFATLKGKRICQAVPLGAEKADTDLVEWEQYGYDNNLKRTLNWNDDLIQTAENSLCVWFSPWQHQDADNPMIPLLLEIKEQFTFRVRMSDKIKANVRPAALASLSLIERCIDACASFAIQKNVNVAKGTSKDILAAWESGKNALTDLNMRQRFHLLFEDAIEQALSSLAIKNKRKNNFGDARLIVFIDDLDRCEESMIINLLESIKLYLSTSHCVFVLGIDDSAVLNALRHHWANRSIDDNREYLEKMFQVTITVPHPDIKKVCVAVSEQLQAHDIGEKLADQCANEICNLIEPNPRKIKNYCNSFCAAWELYKNPSDDTVDETKIIRFLIFHYLRIFHTPVWRLLERQPQLLKLLHYVFRDAPPQEQPAIEGMESDESSIVIEFFYRSFVHVLGRLSSDENRTYRNMDIEQAVTLFEQRIDRKKSDQYFKELIKSKITTDDCLDQSYLCLSHIKEVTK